MTQEFDKQLLESAAKAAGIEIFWHEHWNCFALKNPTSNESGQARHTWTPLEDDGDALRLAVKTGISVLRFFSMTTAKVNSELDWSIDERDDGDAYAATRRAIVRAAATIGRHK